MFRNPRDVPKSGMGTRGRGRRDTSSGTSVTRGRKMWDTGK